MNQSENKSKIIMALAMGIFGTTGVFRRYIPLSSSIIALARGAIGTIFLIIVILAAKKKFSWADVKANRLCILISGGLLGFNWILLFEAYQYTSVATATLCYYMAPVFVILASPLLLREKLTLRKVICVLAAIIGMVMVSGVIGEGTAGTGNFRGVLLGLGAAVLYASIVILNKKIHDIAAYDKTIMQLGIATIVMIPYILVTEDPARLTFMATSVIMLLVIGVVHTGIAYVMYFGSMDSIPAQSVAVLSYIDPVVAIILSALILHEAMGILQVIGAALILGATMISELYGEK